MFILAQLKKKKYKDATNIFRKFAREEEENDNLHNTIKELIQLVQTDNSVSQFIDLLYEIKHNNIEKQTKNICSLNQKDKSDTDPLVNLEIEGYHVRARFWIVGKYYDSRHMGIVRKTLIIRVRHILETS